MTPDGSFRTEPTNRLSANDLRRRFSGDTASAGRVRGDHDLNPGFAPVGVLRDAAVLVPLVDRDDGVSVLLTERNAHLSAHAGQISFPGGRRETEDASPEDNALRETREEIGLERERIEVLGRLDTYVTRTGFRVIPVVGLVHPPFDLTPDPVEVANVFEIPLAVVLDPRNPEKHSRELFGKTRYFYAFSYGEWCIWGATAGMLVNLRDVLNEMR